MSRLPSATGYGRARGAALALAALLLGIAPCAAAQTAPAIQIEESEGETLCTITARDVPAALALEELGRRTGRDVRGLDRVADLGRVDVRLLRRPLGEAVHRVAGAAGLRARVSAEAIEVALDGGDATAAELEDLAEVTILRTLRARPDHPRAAEMELALGEIQESRGNWSAARGTYDRVVERHPGSDHVPAALLRAGLLLERLGEWADAASRYTTLGNLEVPHRLEPAARLGLARCSAELGRPQQALYMLDALESRFPALDGREERERLLVRARALNGVGEPLEALRCLDRVEVLDGGTASADTMRERGRALELAGRADEAATAWLAFATELEGEARGAALAEATRLALAAGDELGATFVARHADELGHGAAVAALAAEARARLGLAPERLDAVQPAARLAQAEELLAGGAAHRARALLEPLTRRRGLAPALALDVACTWARAAHADGDLDAAVAALRRAAIASEGAEARRRIYLLAARLFEASGRYEEAARAYGGEL